MDESLGGHLIDERERLPERGVDGFRVAAVDGCADVPQGASKPGAKLAVVVATLDVLAVRFQRRIVTGHCWIDPCNG